MKSLKEELEQIKDDREWAEYPLVGVLLLICLAIMCGCNSIREIERWGQARRWELSERLGFRRNRMPSEKELRLILKRVDRAGLENILGRWGEAIWQELKGEGLPALSMDGKKLKGSRHEDLPALHLLSVVAHEVQVVLGQVEVDSHTNEITGAVPLLTELVLEGRVVTVDALLTQREIAEIIVEKGGTT
jgi:hypothetical protein